MNDETRIVGNDERGVDVHVTRREFNMRMGRERRSIRMVRIWDAIIIELDILADDLVEELLA